MQTIFTTERLAIRQWTMDDVEAAFAMYGDPVVMRYLGRQTPPLPDLDAMSERLQAHVDKYQTDPRHGFWAIETIQDPRVVGTVILKQVPNVPDIEVGWHLPQREWGNGFATEAGAGALRHGFEAWNLDEIVSLAYAENTRSLAIMARIGMTYQGTTDRFYDVTTEWYKITRAEWRAQQSKPSE